MALAGYSKRHRKTRRSSRKSKRTAFGVLTHRGAAQTSVRQHAARVVTVKVNVWRHPGASRERQFCADAYLPRGGGTDRRRSAGRTGMRSGPAACASTPTLATKRALRRFVGERWT